MRSHRWGRGTSDCPHGAADNIVHVAWLLVRALLMCVLRGLLAGKSCTSLNSTGKPALTHASKVLNNNNTKLRLAVVQCATLTVPVLSPIQRHVRSHPLSTHTLAGW